jgi:hypothetical protein
LWGTHIRLVLENEKSTLIVYSKWMGDKEPFYIILNGTYKQDGNYYSLQYTKKLCEDYTEQYSISLVMLDKRQQLNGNHGESDFIMCANCGRFNDGEYFDAFLIWEFFPAQQNKKLSDILNGCKMYKPEKNSRLSHLFDIFADEAKTKPSDELILTTYPVLDGTGLTTYPVLDGIGLATYPVLPK